ncbi:2,3-diaminopropionate biosynthesis protein SbnB [Lipingzhangella sp. LS1_29]|uniref:2,3-diaminopropionate biosynthesis protein SbnB n=1 Tax=Lipingzhangella rawalii TaxID=2055835 RepID=A0ABU2H2S4_9ACTN|nr:2,3-diaminopropionate biosynthesis protein SbnB [Lipingzhangella rawalii]MDS1269609.1 2,3-diaminopropionate biosynthesis protein SbnB [Lipingzhangella rawalii]
MVFSVVGGATARRIIEDARPDIVSIVRDTYLEHHCGRSANPGSSFLRFPEKPDARIISLPSFLAERGVAGIKWVSSFPENISENLPRASAVLVLNDGTTGYPFACLEAAHISAARTAASAALAAEQILGRRSAERVLFVGAGVLARTFADFLADLKWTLGAAEVYDLEPRYSQALSHHLGQLEIPACPVTEVAPALARADLVFLATTASCPWLTDPSLLRPGQCVLNVSLRDLAPDLLLSAGNVVDDVEHCLTANTSPHLAEQDVGHRDFIDGTIAGLLLGTLAPRLDRPWIVSPFGLGVLDLAVGHHVYQIAVRDNQVTPVPDFLGQTERWEG